MRADAGVQIVGFHLAPVSTALTLFFSWAQLNCRINKEGTK